MEKTFFESIGSLAKRGCFFKETRLKIDYRVRSIRYQILQV